MADDVGGRPRYESDNRLRAQIRSQSCLTKNIVGLLQSCSLGAVEELLTSKIDAIDELRCPSETVTHKNNLRGLRAVLQELPCTENINSRSVRHSFMVFDEAFALFSSFHPNRTFEHLQDPNLRKFFKEILCHPKHGLPVYVINNELVLLRSHDVDLEKFIEELFTTIKHKDHSRLQLFRSLIQNMLNSMDSEWDKKVMKVLIGATHTKRELTTFGIGSRINKYTYFVFSNVEKRVELENEAKNLVTNNLKRKADNLSKLIKKEEFNLTQKRQKWNDAQLNGLKDRIEDLDEQHASTLEILSNENGRAFKQMVRRKQRSLITKKRIGMRKASQGRSQVMDEVDEHYVMQCIEEKATAHGRRHDNIMYLSHRVKKKDF